MIKEVFIHSVKLQDIKERVEFSNVIKNRNLIGLMVHASTFSSMHSICKQLLSVYYLPDSI